MSNSIRFDSLLLRALAVELDERLRGARSARAWFERRARVLALELGRRRERWTMGWHLHPAGGHLTFEAGSPRTRGALLQVPAGTRVARVTALPDERVLRIDLEVQAAARGLVRALVIELLGSRWNALALGEADVIMDVLVPRPEGGRPLRAGIAWAPPPVRPRQGVNGPPPLERWVAALAAAPPAERRSILIATFAFTSPLNVGWILGEAASDAGEQALDAAYRRYRVLLEAPAQPCLLPDAQPYSHPLDSGAPTQESLLAAFEAAAAVRPRPPIGGAAAQREELLVRLHERGQRLRARRARLAQETSTAGGRAPALRARADLLLSRLAEVPRGRSLVALLDFEGNEVSLALDPAASPQENASRWYEEARRAERAAERGPALIARIDRELARVEAAVERMGTGTATEAELEEWLRLEPPRPAAGALPYRQYRTTGGLEVRVGRSARANDALTSRHSSPEDIWLHARPGGGAHVILRWGRRDANPPHSELVQAAVLAALHSRARTSGLVAVDWTRRKYVRKPRKAAPGEVLTERVKTIFVEPDAGWEARLRAGDAG